MSAKWGPFEAYPGKYVSEADTSVLSSSSINLVGVNLMEGEVFLSLDAHPKDGIFAVLSTMRYTVFSHGAPKA
ncbi:hypothetical protein STEG23_019296 [Scotinomys teguina]